MIEVRIDLWSLFVIVLFTIKGMRQVMRKNAVRRSRSYQLSVFETKNPKLKKYTTTWII
jgi:hypothetical protein